jgi:Meiotically Up-regulated Gene 113 (MUG113) protein
MNTGKRHILAEIKRLAEVSSGRPPGAQALARETGVKKSDWYPHLWLRWGDALQAAGLAPNTFGEAPLTDEYLVEQYARFAQRLSHLPVKGELIREKKANASFPSGKTFDRFGGKGGLLKAVVAFCRAHPGFGDVLGFCEAALNIQNDDNDRQDERKSRMATGFVYLMKSGPHYKIGRTNSLARREWELGIKIPVPPRTIHYVETDDPVGIEAYWHKRFEAKRGEGEWFNLSAEDVVAFKRWKRIV